MRIQIFQNWRLGLAVILLAVVVNWQIISAADEELDKYNNTNFPSYEDAVVSYHTSINEILNKNIEILLNSPEKPNVAFDKDCPEDNVSTYCVAKELVDEYMKFISSIDSHHTYLSPDLAASFSHTEATEYLGDVKLIIQEEKDVAFRAMDQALAIYNELQITYPLHQQYEVIIDTLESYNAQLAEWRTALSEWPSDFIDVSTNKCS